MTYDVDSPDFQQRYVEQLAQLDEDGVRLELSGQLLVLLVGAVQLGLRHPNFPPTSKEALIPWIEGTADALDAKGLDALAAAVRIGDNYREGHDERPLS